MVVRFHNEVNETNLEKFIIHQIMIIKEKVNEVTRAAQMAKGGIINSNVLDGKEIHRIIDKVATLLYSNELEAMLIQKYAQMVIRFFMSCYHQKLGKQILSTSLSNHPFKKGQL